MSKLSEFLYGLRENKPFICVLLFLSYTFGVFAFYHHETFLIASVFTFVLLALYLFVSVIPNGLKSIPALSFVILYLIFIFGFYNAKVHFTETDSFSDISYYKGATIYGVVKNIPKYNSSNNTYKFPFKVKRAILNGEEFQIKDTTVLAVIKNYNDADINIRYGDKLSLTGILTTPSVATNPSQFDYGKFLKYKGILKTFYSNDSNYKFISPPLLSDVKSAETFAEKIEALNISFIRFMDDLRDGVIKKHSKYVKTPRLEVLGGVVFGDDAVNPPDDVKGSFINSGLLHLLAASGLNVALILSMWLCVIYFINIPYRLKILSGILIVFLYTLMTGFPPSIVRASVMLVLILTGKLLYREANGISLIFMAGLLILIFKPEFLSDVGFQLSFLVTLGLIICVPCVCRLLSSYDKNYIKKIKNCPKIVKSFLLVFSPTSIVCCVLIPFVAQLWAGPLQAYYFNTFSLYSVFANISVVPFIGIVSFLGFISTAFCFIPFASDIILPVLDFILNFIIQIVLNISNFFANLPNSIIRVPSPEPFPILLFYFLVIFFFVSLKHSFKKKILNIFFLIFLILLSFWFIKFPDNSSEVIFFNVGNADNCLIKTPKNKYILIDTGKYIYTGSSSAKTVTLEYFYDKSIKEIDTLIVTHYDSDHSGGLVDILKAVKVKNLIIPPLECNSKNSCEIMNYIRANKIEYIHPVSGQTFLYEPDIRLVNFVPDVKGRNSRNETSTVTLLEFGQNKFLFMADAGIKAYNSIEKEIPSDIFALKSAHHGAKDTVDDKMLKKLRPEYSILSTGRNPYGHPDIETKELLCKYSKVLSTKDLGAIKFKIKDKIEVFNFDSNKKRFIEIKN